MKRHSRPTPLPSPSPLRKSKTLLPDRPPRAPRISFRPVYFNGTLRKDAGIYRVKSESIPFPRKMDETTGEIVATFREIRERRLEMKLHQARFPFFLVLRLEILTAVNRV